jgi:hypothetical protein
METSVVSAILDGPLDTTALRVALHRELLRLAAVQEREATAEASRIPYWGHCPSSVTGHRAAAEALRADAQRFMRVPETV